VQWCWDGTKGNVGKACRGKANGGGDCCSVGNEVDENFSRGGSGGNNNGCGDVGSGCGNGEAEAWATAMAVTSLAASGGSDSGNSTTADFCNAILLQYADVADVRSDGNGNCTPTCNKGNIDGGVTNCDNGV
jgi:hypothetical protein